MAGGDGAGGDGFVGDSSRCGYMAIVSQTIAHPDFEINTQLGAAALRGMSHIASTKMTCAHNSIPKPNRRRCGPASQ